MIKYQERFEMCLEIVDDLQAIAVKYFRQESLETFNKGSGKVLDPTRSNDTTASVQGVFDPVTAADKEIETHFRNVVHKRFPDDRIIGEEFADHEGQGSLEWVIDPIDGTRAFLIGSPTFTTLIALKEKDRALLGVISQPFTGERFIGGPEGAIWKRGQSRMKISCSDCLELGKAKIATTFPEIGTALERRAFEAVSRECLLTRYGMDGYAYALLAAGHIDLVIEAGLKRFDYEAPKALIEFAGGVFCGWDGNEVKSDGRVLAAATPELAAKAIQILTPIMTGE